MMFKLDKRTTGERHRTPLYQLSRELNEMCPKCEQSNAKVTLQVDNAWPHTAKLVKNYSNAFEWEVLPCSTYLLDIEPSDHYLLQSMAHGMANKKFHSFEDISIRLEVWNA